VTLLDNTVAAVLALLAAVVVLLTVRPQRRAADAVMAQPAAA
jgi:hypothetical protein